MVITKANLEITQEVELVEPYKLEIKLERDKFHPRFLSKLFHKIFKKHSINLLYKASIKLPRHTLNISWGNWLCPFFHYGEGTALYFDLLSFSSDWGSFAFPKRYWSFCILNINFWLWFDRWNEEYNSGWKRFRGEDGRIYRTRINEKGYSVHSHKDER